MVHYYVISVLLKFTLFLRKFVLSITSNIASMITDKKSQNLSTFNTFRMNVKCSRFIEYDAIADLINIDFDSLPKPVKHIGGGSNLLFSGDFKGTILHSAVKFIYTLPQEDNLYNSDNEVIVSVGSGVIFDDFCKWATENGLWGVENLSYIPGETGAAAVQNIGAYGSEVSESILQVYCYDTKEEEFVHFDADECGYGYRDSIFKSKEIRDRYIVTNVIFRLTPEFSPKLDYGHVREAVEKAVADAGLTEPTPMLIRNAIIGIRKEKLPEVSEIGSAGSFFKNPVIEESEFQRIASTYPEIPHYITDNGIKIPAAWLIEQCGWKGRTRGNAGVYCKQPLVIINATGKATPQEIITLKDNIIDSVKEKFGITLQPEAEII